jgi:hypothetical protein
MQLKHVENATRTPQIRPPGRGVLQDYESRRHACQHGLREVDGRDFVIESIKFKSVVEISQPSRESWDSSAKQLQKRRG